MKPKKVKDRITFYPLEKVNTSKYFNRYNLPDVPHEYEVLVADLFYRGGKLKEFSTKIDSTKAAQLVREWLTSWEPAHEAKMATVAYAFWVWDTLDN